jgi:hypothetical protein
MGMLKRMAIVASAIMVLASVPASGANIPDEQYLFTYKTVFPNGNAPDGWFGVWFSDKPNYPSVPILSSGVPGGKNVYCSSINDEECKEFKSFGFVANYPFCTKDFRTDCIEDVFAIDGQNKKISGTNIEYLPKNPITLNQKSNYHPGGSSKEIFDLPGVTHQGGSSKYSIEVMMSGGFNIQDRSVPYSGYSSSDASFYVNISPVDLKSGNYELINSCESDWGFCQPAKFDRSCVVLDVDRCGMAQSFPTGYKFGVSIRMGTPIYGWLQGRIRDASFNSEDIPGGKKITVAGYPMTVPSISGGGQYSTQLTPTLKTALKEQFINREYPNFDNYTADRGTAALKAFSDWAPVLGEKATVMPSVWSFRNIKKDEFAVAGLQAGRCIVSAMKSGIGGMVTTNATVYSSGPPAFNEETQSLDYRVAAPHFTSQGQVFRGYYNLKIKADTARCIYNFKPIPMKATISIVSDAGEKIVGTSIVKSNDEWVELTATNFEFSSPTLRVKLSDKVTFTSSKIKKSIRCTDGKKDRIVSGEKPKCPKGFKQVK